MAKLLAAEHDTAFLAAISLQAHESWLCFSLADLGQEQEGETLATVGLCKHSFTMQLRNQLFGKLALEVPRSHDQGESQEAI